MKVYVDVIFFINTFFDFILLLSVSLILRRKVKLYRLILGALTGGISIFFLFFKINSLTLFLLKILIAILMVIMSFNYRDFLYTLKNFLYLYIVSIVLGGALYFLNLEFSYKNNGLIFYHKGISINIIIILIISPILLFLYVKEMKSLKNNYSKYYDVEIYIKNENIVLKGFLDSGNNLLDPYKNRPIIIAYCKSIEKYITKEKELIVPYNTMNGSCILKCIKPKKVIINGNEYRDILLGISNEKIYIDGIDCILNNNLDI